MIFKLVLFNHYYRPVSVLPVFSKLLERLVYNRLISHINDNKLLYEYQFGFKKGKSTYLAIMMLVDKITEALDQGESVVGGFQVRMNLNLGSWQACIFNLSQTHLWFIIFSHDLSIQ